MVALICDGEFDQPNSDNKDYSALQVNFYANATAYTIRKNLKTGLFEKMDKTGAVNATFATFALALADGKTDALVSKGITITDAACDHTITKKGYCAIFNGAWYIAPVIEVVG